MREIYRVDQFPVFQNKMYDSPEIAITYPKGDVILVQDAENGLIFNSAFDPALMQYDPSYQNEQACSTTFIKHLCEVGQIIQRYCKGMKLVEIGCGKGHFLEYLSSLGFQVTGFDPAYEGSNARIKRHTTAPDSP